MFNHKGRLGHVTGEVTKLVDGDPSFKIWKSEKLIVYCLVGEFHETHNMEAFYVLTHD